MSTAAHRRITWEQVPERLRAAVGEVLGAPVVEAISQTGGFSPGSADRVITAAGERAFVKTASVSLNAESVDIHRAEARVAAVLPPDLPVPRLRGVVEDDGWIALVFDEADGRPPRSPWRADELDAALQAYREVGRRRLGASVALPALDELLASDFRAWERLPDESFDVFPIDVELADWAVSHRDRLRVEAGACVTDLAGDRLVHFDARADNLLVTADGGVVIVDWPWAARGASWFDPFSLLATARVVPGHPDLDAVLAAHPAFDDMPAGAADRCLAALAGFMLERSRRPAVEAIPTLRRFQHDQAVACLAWLRDRWR